MNECDKRELPLERNERGKIYVENPFKELIKGRNGEWPSAVQRKATYWPKGGDSRQTVKLQIKNSLCVT